MEKPFFFITILLLACNITQSLVKRFNQTTDQHALLAFKNTLTSDPNGFLINNWSSNAFICHWIGVTCGITHHRVTSLNVSGFELRGIISPHLGNLTFLLSLDLSSNNFTGFIPSELSNLHRLKYITLEDNQITGFVPNGMFTIASLIHINLRENMLSGKLPNDICNNTANIKRIYLSRNQFYGEIPENIHMCRELEDLALTKNHFSGNIPTQIGSLSMLRNLYLGSNNFQGSIPCSIFNISSLIVVNLSENNLSGSIPTDSLQNLSEIEEIDFYGNNLTGGIPKQIVNLTSLAWLDFALNKLTGELPRYLDNLAYLEVFVASFNDLSGSLTPSIFNISRLISLQLQQNHLSGGLPSNMGLSLFSLEELYLYFNRFSGEIPRSITNASKLTTLELNRNAFSGSIPNFGNLQSLQVLRLWENRLIGAESPTQELEFLSSLTNCQYLKVLEVTDNPLNGILPTSIGNLSTFLVRFVASYCNINGVIPPEIGSMRILQVLHLSENQLTGFIPTSLGKLGQLGELYLGGNRLEGYIPSDLCQITNLVELNLSINMLTGPIHECFGEVKSLRRISLASNKLNSSIPSKFWNLVDLITLNLSSNYLTGKLSSQIGSWKINELDLSSNQFTGYIPSSIDGCRSLEVLSLSSNKFRGFIPQSLGNVKGLRILDLSNNNLSGIIPKSLEELSGLEYFNVSYNKLEGEIPNGGCFGNFSATSFVHNFALCGETRFQVPQCVKKHGRSQSTALILKYILPSFILVFILVVAIFMLIKRRKQIKVPPSDQMSLNIDRRRISYIELARGTSSFSETNLLGRGSFGSVFKGTLPDGLTIAVKVFNLQLEGATKSFDTESEILSSIRHRNLVPVIGCCTNTEFKALILEYMPNGSLEQWLHSDDYCLDLVQKLKIATDVALALEYLHHGHTFPIVHCDIKPSNVLLDEDMTAHVGDFGISKLFDQGETMTQTITLATIGYAAPEYGSEGKISTNGDVYSFGILLLEMFTRRKPTDDMFSEEMGLKEWVNEAVEANALRDVMAPGLLSSEDRLFSAQEQCVLSIFHLAFKCSAFSPNERIHMIQVVTALHKIEAKLTVATQVNQRRNRR